MYIRFAYPSGLEREGNPPLYPTRRKTFAMVKNMRSELVLIRMTKEEKEALKKKAEAVGGMSALLRKFAGGARIRDRKSEREKIAMLNRLNANMNMIAKHCNIYKSGTDAVEIIAHLIGIEREVKRLVEVMDK